MFACRDPAAGMPLRDIAGIKRIRREAMAAGQKGSRRRRPPVAVALIDSIPLKST
jgi:hypothetical protein